MANLIYILQESFDGFRRAKISALISTMTITFLLIIIGIFVLVSTNVDHIVTALSAKFDIQAFIDNTLDDSQITSLREQISQIEGIQQVSFYSKEEAAREFQQEFGKELFDILGENPLPSSFNVVLRKENRTPENIESVARQISALRGIDDVVYNNQALKILSKYAQMAKVINSTILIFVSFGSLFVISNTVRLIIIAKRDIITTMQLVGATRGFIQSPFIIEGLVQGLAGGILASVFVFLGSHLLMIEVPGLIHASIVIYMFVLLLGVIFGILGSLFAIKRFL
jgi:cell division transport system permease protein